MVAAADVLWLAVKPQQMGDVLAGIAGALRRETLVVSIAAGVTIERIAAGLPAGARIVRVMPNTPCLIGRGASAYSLGGTASEEDGKLVGEFLAAVGAAFAQALPMEVTVPGPSRPGVSTWQASCPQAQAPSRSASPGRLSPSAAFAQYGPQ